jgi:hypothetical protein
MKFNKVESILHGLFEHEFPPSCILVKDIKDSICSPYCTSTHECTNLDGWVLDWNLFLIGFTTWITQSIYLMHYLHVLSFSKVKFLLFFPLSN